jgi:hypothetical protein
MNDNNLIWRITLSVILAIVMLLSMVTGCVVHENQCTLEAIKAGVPPASASGAFTTPGGASQQLATIEAMRQPCAEQKQSK